MVLAGTAHEVSFLIDFLPSYLFPNGERTIDTWAVAGVSLGGHSTWHCLKDGAYEKATSALLSSSFLFDGHTCCIKKKDPRVTIGIPIIGRSHFHVAHATIISRLIIITMIWSSPYRQSLAMRAYRVP
jgi:hypothetical protein